MGGKRTPALTSVAQHFVPGVICLILPACTSSASSSELPGGAPSLLQPASDAAARIERLRWVVFWISTLVVEVVVGVILTAVIGRAGGRPATRSIALRYPGASASP